MSSAPVGQTIVLLLGTYNNENCVDRIKLLTAFILRFPKE